MYCKNCGVQMNENQAICLSCGCAKGTGTKFCANCGAELQPNAAVCMSCGVASTFGTEGAKTTVSTASASESGWCPKDKDKIVAIILALFLGGLGIHNFYLGETKKGVLRLLLCWCGVGSILALIDLIKMITGSYTVSSEKFV